jgi:hypothetical protein
MSITYFSRKTLLFIALLFLVPVAVSAVTLTGNVLFRGNLAITGALSKGGGTFVIDHPLDPKNKLLYHSFVESPDVKNMYDGIVTLDTNGEAQIVLPQYFIALNKEYRYLATPLHGAMPELHLKAPVTRSFMQGDALPFFVIGGGEPGGVVSWQVTGIRHDPLIEVFPIVPEVEKTDDTPVKKGECLFEPLCQ